MQTDGKIVIGTELDTSKFEKELDDFFDDVEKSGEQVKDELEEYVNSAVERLIEKAKEAGKEIDSGEIRKSIEKLVNDTKKQMEELDPLFERYGEVMAEYLEITNKSKGSLIYESDKTHAQELKTELENIVLEIEKITGEKIKIAGVNDTKYNLDDIGNKLNDIGSSMKDVIKKVVKWGLAIFSVRSAYLFIRSSVATLSQFNEQLATDIQYIRFALASSLQKTIENIIQLVYKLLTYTAYIAKAWFGVNLFANASTEAFEKTNKAVQDTNSSAKELKKTLAGFDEMNILQEDGSVASGGGGGGITLPSVDLSNWESVEIPKWIEWIGKNRDLILGFFSGIAGIIAGIKLSLLLTGLTSIFDLLKNMSGLQIFGLISGIAIIAVGIYETIQGIIKFIQDPTWENFVGILSGLSTILIGISAIMIAINSASPIGWITLTIGAISKLITVLFNEEQQAYSTKDAEKALEESRKKVAEATDEYIQAVDNAELAEKRLKEAEQQHQLSGETLYKQVQEGTLDYKNMNKEQREVYKAYLANLQAQEKVKTTSKDLDDTNKEAIKTQIETQLKLAKTTKDYGLFKEAIYDAMRKGKLSAEEAGKYMEQAMQGMSAQSRKTFVEEIPSDIMQAFETTKYAGQWNRFKSWWNYNINGLDTDIDIRVNYGYGNNGLYSSGIWGYAKGGIVVPKLASGGIINRPSRGVPIGQAIGGEHGMEGVIPLTDSQQMELLGEAIGRYITINANITNTMNGRVISRELQKVQNDSDFAFNR